MAGTIIIQKVISGTPDTETGFSVFVGPDLVPASYSLVGGDSQTISSVPVGEGYTVAEVVPTGWEQLSVSVSNGDLPDNITIEEGETVTVIFTNSLIDEVPDPEIPTELPTIFTPLWSLFAFTIKNRDEDT